MTEETVPETESPEKKKRKKYRVKNDPDGFTLKQLVPKDRALDYLLHLYVGFDDDADGSIGVTVTSNGIVVSGIAVSRKAWIEGNLQLIREGGGEENGSAASLEKLWAMMIDDAEKLRKKRRKRKLPLPARRYIHLKDARIGSPGDFYNVPFWRGNLDDISGWALGSTNPPLERDDLEE
jgi:hypothetical protein